VCRNGREEEEEDDVFDDKKCRYIRFLCFCILYSVFFLVVHICHYILMLMHLSIYLFLYLYIYLKCISWDIFD